MIFLKDFSATKVLLKSHGDLFLERSDLKFQNYVNFLVNDPRQKSKMVRFTFLKEEYNLNSPNVKFLKSF